MTAEPAAIQTLRALKGTALHVLTAMLVELSGGAVVVTAAAIAADTGYSPDAIEPGLKALIALGHANQVGRYQYMLTAAGRQLPLPLFHLDQTAPPAHMSSLTPLKAESAAGSSSSLNEIKLIKETTTTTPTPQKAESALQNGLANGLTRLGCGATMALAAIQRALDAGDTAELIQAKIETLADYAASPQGRSLRLPGLWAAGIVENHLDPPDVLTTTPNDDLSGYNAYHTGAPNDP